MRHVDTQSTLPLGRGDSLVQHMARAAGDEVLCLETMQHACGQMELPAGTCRDLEVYSRESPGTVADFVYRYAMDEPDRAFECVKWVRIVARYHDACFEALDPVLGSEAKGLHQVALEILLQESKLHEANQDFLTRAKVIRSLGAKKTQQLIDGPSSGLTKQRLDQIQEWVDETLEKSEAPRQKVKAVLDEHIARLMSHVDAMLTGAQAQHEAKIQSARTLEDERLLLADLEARLDMPVCSPVPTQESVPAAQGLKASPEAGVQSSQPGDMLMVKLGSGKEASLAMIGEAGVNVMYMYTYLYMYVYTYTIYIYTYIYIYIYIFVYIC